MGKYNTRKESIEPTCINYVGEMAFKLKEKQELVSTMMTTFLHGAYFENESEIVERIKELV